MRFNHKISIKFSKFSTHNFSHAPPLSQQHSLRHMKLNVKIVRINKNDKNTRAKQKKYTPSGKSPSTVSIVLLIFIAILFLFFVMVTKKNLFSSFFSAFV